ncbi:MAG TPA: cell division ATP-binding protein FtsE [Clostridia bacterium]|nr:cell division ATP-binding protein FtsE [Clostridia bacterium]
MITFKNVTKRYAKGVVALKGINLNIARGEFVFIVGPTGAGKSTLTKLIYCEELPTEGSVVVAGKDTRKLPRREICLLRRSVGVVFQDFRLLSDRNVFDNVAFALRVVETPKKEIRKRVMAALELVGLRDKCKNMPHELSGGEQQRAVLARALVAQPSILIADEPTGNLDPQTSWEIMKVLCEVNRLGTTVVMATHAKSIVDSLKKRVIELASGQVVRDDASGSYGYDHLEMSDEVNDLQVGVASAIGWLRRKTPSFVPHMAKTALEEAAPAADPNLARVHRRHGSAMS